MIAGEEALYWAQPCLKFRCLKARECVRVCAPARAASGMWEGNAPHGEGVQHCACGDWYSGSMVRGSRHGAGRYHFAADSCQLTGVWSNGSLIEGSWVRTCTWCWAWAEHPYI